MKLSLRIWILAIVLLFSIIWIINLSSYGSVLLFALGLGSLFVLTSVKSKVGKIILLVLLFLSAVFLVYQQTESGIIIKSIEQNSTAYEQGLRQGQMITAINQKPVNTVEDYYNEISEEFSEPLSEPKKILITTKDQEVIMFLKEAPKITVSSVSKLNIRLGLDLQGGSRALVRAENTSLNAEELRDLIDITSNRLNVYGLSDLTIRSVSDLSGNNYMLIEIAGATPNELEELIGQQGKFEAKIGNETVFIGGSGVHVESSGQYTGIEGCYDSQEGGQFCRFRFSLTLSPEYAKNHARITSALGISAENPEYLEKQLDLYVDGVLIDSLYISRDLKGQETTQISIQGSGKGPSRQEALDDAEQNMRKLQTILKTGSLPYKLEIVKLDTISPTLGKQFLRTILLAGLVALIAVAFIVLLRYRKFKLPLALLLTSFSEIIIILGFASLTNNFWTLDLPAIAGIIAVIGTGVDQQIVVLDESSSDKLLSLKQRLKRAAAIILGSYLTTLGAMVPLMWSGAGLLRGFAIATIVGITVGVFVTRPAFSDIVKKVVD